jgi:hypothetical protein
MRRSGGIGCQFTKVFLKVRREFPAAGIIPAVGVVIVIGVVTVAGIAARKNQSKCQRQGQHSDQKQFLVHNCPPQNIPPIQGEDQTHCRTAP